MPLRPSDPSGWDNDPGDFSRFDNVAEDALFELYYRDKVSAKDFDLSDPADRVEWDAYEAWRLANKLPELN